MKITTYKTKEEWLIARRGKITGSTLKDIVSASSLTVSKIQNALIASDIEFDKKEKKDVLENLLPLSRKIEMELEGDKKMGFYELIAQRLATIPDEENPMDRGIRLEPEAIEKYVEITGEEINTELVLWQRDEEDNIALSPDGFKNDLTKAVEVKCLSSALQIKTFLTQQIPDEYKWQRLQYFMVNDELETLVFAFYDPRIPCKSFFTIEFKREDLQTEINYYLEYERKTLKEVNKIVNELTF